MSLKSWIVKCFYLDSRPRIKNQSCRSLCFHGHPSPGTIYLVCLTDWNYHLYMCYTNLTCIFLVFSLLNSLPVHQSSEVMVRVEGTNMPSQVECPLWAETWVLAHRFFFPLDPFLNARLMELNVGYFNTILKFHYTKILKLWWGFDGNIFILLTLSIWRRPEVTTSTWGGNGGSRCRGKALVPTKGAANGGESD